MTISALDNPFWSSLQSVHRKHALRAGEVARFPPDFAPFLGVAHADAATDEALAELIAPDESVYLIGVAPKLSDTWSLRAYAPLAQMICDAPIEVVDGPVMIELTEEHRTDVLALTALVYPHYFRPRTKLSLGSPSRPTPISPVATPTTAPLSS